MPERRDRVIPPRTKIVATIGPASESPEMVEALIRAGVNIFRFNFSHGAFEEHERRLRTVRECARRLNRVIGCLGDLPGPKIRIGKVEGAIELRPGEEVVFDPDIEFARVEATPDGERAVLPVTYDGIAHDVEAGQRILLADGALRMLALRTDGRRVYARVTVGGTLTSGKGINLPESEVSAPAITDRDWACVEWAVAHGLDFLALSFVRTPREVRELKDRLWSMCSVNRDESDGGGGSMIQVIAKIEKPQAVARIDAIVEAADGIMVARGDLGVEMEIAGVPVAQKRIIASCRAQGKPVIVATQMLETMIENPTPTRAEASDVANAIYDGASCVMLSGETAVGRHPDLVVETMVRIIEATEDRLREIGPQYAGPTQILEKHTMTAALTTGAWYAGERLDARAIACWSENGGTARYLSQMGFLIPILACSTRERATRRMTILPGITPMVTEPPASGSVSEWNAWAVEELRERGWAEEGQWVVLLAGRPLGQPRRTNSMTLHRVGDDADPARAGARSGTPSP